MRIDLKVPPIDHELIFVNSLRFWRGGLPELEIEKISVFTDAETECAEKSCNLARDLCLIIFTEETEDSREWICLDASIELRLAREIYLCLQIIHPPQDLAHLAVEHWRSVREIDLKGLSEVDDPVRIDLCPFCDLILQCLRD